MSPAVRLSHEVSKYISNKTSANSTNKKSPQNALKETQQERGRWVEQSKRVLDQNWAFPESAKKKTPKLQLNPQWKFYLIKTVTTTELSPDKITFFS